MPTASSANRAVVSDAAAASRFRQATSRADLLWWLLRSGEADGSLDRVAPLLGLVREVERVEQVELLFTGGVVEEVISPPPPSLPPNPQSGARYLRVTHHHRSPLPPGGDPAYSGPECLRDVAPLDAAALKPLSSEPSPAQLPLVPWSRLWPFLKTTLGGTQQCGLDVPRLVAKLARGDALLRFPQRARQRWAPDAVVLIDFAERLTPFWDDFNQLCTLLGLLRGKLGLQLLVHQPALDGDGITRVRPWRQFDHPGQAWPHLAAGTPLLILGDVGLLDDPASPRSRQWLKFGRQLNAQGIRPQVLAPISPQCITPAALAHFELVCWSPDNPLRRREHGTDELPVVEDLLALLSPAIRIEPALLRAAVRLLAPAALQAGVEAAFWSHADVGTSALGCEIMPEKLEQYRRRFADRPAAQQRSLLQLLQRQHAHCAPFVVHEETLTWAAHASPAVCEDAQAAIIAAGRFMNRAAATVYQESTTPDGAKIAYTRRALQRADTLLREGQPYLSVFYAQAYREALQANSRAIDENGLDGQEVLRALQSPQEKPRVVLLRQRGAELWLENPPDPATVPRARIGATLLPEIMVAKHLEIIAYVDGQAQQTSLLPVSAMPQRLLALDPGMPTLRLVGPFDDLTIEALPRPSWACEIQRREDGLFAAVSWLGEEHWLQWLPGEGEQWTWQALGTGPVGWDQYGLFAVFELGEVSQVCRWMEPDSFLMGSPEGEAQRYDDETLHEVTLTQGYWLADSACTQALWQAVMGDNLNNFKDSPQHPVEMVSWNDIQTFLVRLNALMPGLEAGLPSEAQWEYACRAGTITPFFFEEITPEQVNYNGNHPYADGGKGEYRKKTVAVKSLPANAWGLYEMHGNVLEWCADRYGQYAEGPQTDPLGAREGVERVLRGGSWYGDAGDCRSADRFRIEPDERSLNIGFRLAPGQRLSLAGAEAARHPTRQQAERSLQGGGSATAAGGMPPTPKRKKRKK